MVSVSHCLNINVSKTNHKNCTKNPPTSLGTQNTQGLQGRCLGSICTPFHWPGHKALFSGTLSSSPRDRISNDRKTSLAVLSFATQTNFPYVSPALGMPPNSGGDAGRRYAHNWKWSMRQEPQGWFLEWVRVPLWNTTKLQFRSN